MVRISLNCFSKSLNCFFLEYINITCIQFLVFRSACKGTCPEHQRRWMLPLWRVSVFCNVGILPQERSKGVKSSMTNYRERLATEFRSYEKSLYGQIDLGLSVYLCHMLSLALGSSKNNGCLWEDMQSLSWLNTKILFWVWVFSCLK